MKVRNEDIRAAFDSEASSLLRSARGCPEVEVHRRIVLGETTDAERAEFADHVAVCSDCAEEYRAARSAENLAIEAARLLPRDAPAADRFATPSGRFVYWTAVAASVLVALGLSVVLLRSSRRQPATSQERGPAVVATAVEPPDQASLAEPPARLAWTPLEGAESYRVVLYDLESTPLWESPALHEPETKLPEAIRSRLASGGTFFWRVETRRKAEKLSSALHRFSLRVGVPGGG